MNHYTYKITHTSGRYYVGRRSTKRDPHTDSYVGSGNWVKSIKDKITLNKIVLEIYNSTEELKSAEMELIEQHYDDEYCMNYLYSSDGAASGNMNHMYGKIGELHPRFGNNHTEETKQLMSLSASGENNSQYGKRCTRSDETKKKISDAVSGEKNHMFGKRGAAHKKATISDAIAKQIYDRCEEGVRDAVVAKEFNTTIHVVRNIKRGLSFVNVTGGKKIVSSKGVGTNHPGAKINEAIARMIKIRISEGIGSPAIAEEFGVTLATVKNIKRGATWKHVTI